MIENDTRLCLLFNSMFEQIPRKKPYRYDPNGRHQVRDHDHMIRVLNHIISTAPEWNDSSHDVGVVGVPLNAFFDWPMGTESGYAVFLDPHVNSMLKWVLNAWGDYLKSPDSTYVLNTSPRGWFGPTSKKSLEDAANVGATSHRFEELYICDAAAKNHGYASWDAFFTREFREGIRPVTHPGRDDVVANACESSPYRVAFDVRRRDRFWIKGQPYSVIDMLAHDELAAQFVGGTIYQAYLNALSYHRWHSPVSGTIAKTRLKSGTYFSEPLFEGFADPHGPNPDGEAAAQGYISAVATRALIFIEADNPAIGLMCVMPVGMVEVSTCDVTVKVGQHVKKGDQLGMVSFLIYINGRRCLFPC
jgi:phosphatidylserine decarboxylase